MEPILAEWELFARTIWPPSVPDSPEDLRDHAADILRATARDMISAQSETQRFDKSGGRGSSSGTDGRGLDRASDLHGAGRVESGFKLKEVISEYRALRATVLRLWRASLPAPDLNDIDDVTRFNESMDQSLARAVASFTEGVDRARQLFLSILGHDLRNPLNAMSVSAQLLRHENHAHPDTAETAERIVAGATVMSRLISDLLDFTGAGLGGGMRIAPAPTNLNEILQEVAQETRVGHPHCYVHYDRDGGDLTGNWDAARLRQVVSNLVGNAVQHGADVCRVNLSAKGNNPASVEFSVHNLGPPIPPESLGSIFDPLMQVASPELQRQRRPGSIGLGLYIAREVVISHGGTIDVTSYSEAGTTFTVRLPRAGKAK